MNIKGVDELFCKAQPIQPPQLKLPTMNWGHGSTCCNPSNKTGELALGTVNKASQGYKVRLLRKSKRLPTIRNTHQTGFLTFGNS